MSIEDLEKRPFQDLSKHSVEELKQWLAFNTQQDVYNMGPNMMASLEQYIQSRIAAEAAVTTARARFGWLGGLAVGYLYRGKISRHYSLGG
jgi:hypothetical protein